MKLVSLIIACYNYGWLLPETLDSVLAQTYPHWECLIIDDGSTDNSRSVAESYVQRDARFRYLYQVNKGMSAARNGGIAAATGDYIQFLDADDLLAPRKLELQVAFLETHPDADLVYGDVRYFRHDTPNVFSRSFNMQDEAWMAEVSGKDQDLLNVLVKKNIMVMNSPLLRTALVQRIGGFTEGLRSMEDWEFWVRCALSGAKFYYNDTPDSWALVRVHPTSTSQNGQRMAQYEILARQRLSSLLEQAGAKAAISINKAAIANQEAYLATDSLLNGDILAGVRRYLRLAYHTGKYGYYLKSILYWLKVRMTKA